MWIAGRIRQLRAEDPELRYRDIAILTRAKSSAAAAMLPVLLAEGIPAYAEGLSATSIRSKSPSSSRFCVWWTMNLRMWR